MRFPEFDGEWSMSSLGECCGDFEYGMNAPAKKFDGINKYIRITDIDDETNRYDDNNPVSPDGNLDNKYIVKKNDILFARTGASTGKTYLYNPNDGKLYFAGFLIRANVKDCNDARFVFQLTQTSKFKKWINVVSMRSGQPGINSQEYASFSFEKPQIQEQKKIAEFLSLLDKRIETQRSAIEKLKSLMAGIRKYAQSLNSCKSTFLRDILTERKEKNTSLYPVYSVAVKEGIINQIEHLGRSFAAKDTANYHVVHEDDIVYTKSPTGNFPYGIVKKSFTYLPVAVSPLYGVYIPKNKDIACFLHYYFLSPVNTNNYLHCLIQKGAKNTINITNQHFLDNTIDLPGSEDLHKIVKGILTIQNKIEIESNTLKCYLYQKSHLLSKMFI